ncbi:MAG: DedA family protein [Candidatus Omnitrophica bacterium]|nr:DedA family protein [Candidatus Omnitrophota bacterium]
MEILKHVLDFFIHLDKHLFLVVQDYGVWSYLILFLIIFCETGLVITPFLPGDSLLFVTGAITATKALDLGTVLGLLCIAAILGDTVNYWIGHILGPKIFSEKYRRFLKPEYLARTQSFFEKYGGKAIILARFFPIIRTFAPFLAGVGKMSYKRFLLYNVIGAFLWIFLFVLAGYFFGNIAFVKKNFTLVIFGIIFVSLLPGVWEYYKHKKPTPSP